MSVKAKAQPIEEDPETKKLREQAEARAEATRFEEAQEYTDNTTRKLIRRFGAKPATPGVRGFSFAPGATGGGLSSFNPATGQYSSVAPAIAPRTAAGLQQSLATQFKDSRFYA
jgi:hypothetical protein